MPHQRIFISYRRTDSAGHAGRLEADLGRRFGSRVFMDVADIAAGENFVGAIERELRSCGAVLALIGPRWRDALDAPRAETDYVRMELRQALAHEGVAVIPVLVQAAGLPSAAELPEDLKPLVSRQAVTLRDDRWDDDVAHLARTLRRQLGLPLVPRWLVAAAAVLLAALAAGFFGLRPEEPGPFDRARAREVAVAAARKAVSRCADQAGARGECPILFDFPASGIAESVYYPVGYCDFKLTPFGECVLEKLAGTRISPFDDYERAEVQLRIRMDASGEATVEAEF